MLCTDSLAAWALRGYEAGRPPDWPAWWQCRPAGWQDAVLELRHRGELRHDDTTLLLLRMAGGNEKIAGEVHYFPVIVECTSAAFWLRNAIKSG